MDDIYSLIAEEYSELFPLDPERVKFVESFLSTDPDVNSILDIGCATGDLAIALSELGYHVEGIDLNQKMIEIAKKKINNTRVTFRIEDMGNLKAVETYQAILCFGNTLPHLKDLGEILAFFQRVYSALKKKGVFLFQILNFDKILEKEHQQFPLIETKLFQFRREYINISPTGIDFSVTLSSKANPEKKYDTTRLFPLQQRVALDFLTKVGFRPIFMYQNYAKVPSDLSEFATLFAAKK